MPNDDGLKEFISGVIDPQWHAWLTELLDAREKIVAMQHSMKFYIERNIELTEAACDAKKILEYWVTQAGMWEAKARGNKEKHNG